MKTLYLSLFCLLTIMQGFSQKVDFNDYKSCKACHADIYSEWETTRHSQSWTSEEYKNQTKGYTKQDCLNCHAPKPLFETGMGKEPVLRDNDRLSGINCLTCHRKNSTVTAVYKDSKGECNPVFTDEGKDNRICGTCHLNTSEEWKKSSYSKPGKSYSTCADCHMKSVKRADGQGREGQGCSSAHHLWGP